MSTHVCIIMELGKQKEGEGPDRRAMIVFRLDRLDRLIELNRNAITFKVFY